MSIVAAFHSTALPSTDRRPLRAALAALGRRLAESPLDSPVLKTVPAPAAPPVGRPAPLRARWRPVTGADGRTRLEASWHAAH
ncbi:hypothetical protein [Kitasatospora sp. NPDC101183]|uniref:hypothetical protein n=1 Tax=Kitasatospora sp. NPDC101183 TaxID=3364100 RepID=UPI003823882B